MKQRTDSARSASVTALTEAGKRARLLTAAGAASIAMLAGPAGASVRVENLRYQSPGNTTRNVFDLYTRTGTPIAGAPTIIDLHGGGYTTGDKGLDQQFCAILADRGYNVVSMNYTLAVPGESSSFPQTIRDVRAMIRWVRTDGVAMGLSPTVVINGLSAGGTIGLVAAYAPENLEFNPPLPAPPGGYRVDACIGLFGRYDLVWDAQTFGSPLSIIHYLGLPITAPGGVERYAAAASTTYVGACSPPTKLVHGWEDGVIHVMNAFRLDGALAAAGRMHVLQVVNGAGHGTGVLGSPTYLADAVTQDLPALLGAGMAGCGLEPPPNDRCEDASPATAGSRIEGSTIGATNDRLGPCASDDTRDVWFRFVPPATARYAIDTLGTTGIADTTLALLSGCGPDAPVIACNDDSGGERLSRLSVVLPAGQPVLIRIAGRTAASGAFVLNIGSGLPPDACAADFNGFGGVTIQDVFDYLAAYFAGAASADFDRNGHVSVQDLLSYLRAFFQSC